MFSVQQYRSIREGAGLRERRDRGRLRLIGADRGDYLQGLLTNDIAALQPGTGCYSAFLTAQGRMITDMRLWELGDSLLMDLPADLAPAVRDRFDQFIFGEDVQVEDVSASQAQFGLYGPRAAGVLAAVLSERTVPASLEALAPFQSTVWSYDGTSVLVAGSDELGVAGFDVFVAREAAEKLADALRAGGAEPLSAETMEVVRIEAGRPAFHADMTADTIPLEAGIEDRAISHTKGCYVGQEIIIRVLHRGQGRVARRLVGLVFGAAAATPSPGDRLYAADREIGSITSAALSPALERPIALGYVHRDFVQPGTEIAVAHGDGREPAVVTQLPFVGPEITE
jgi:folate-binding protein YgfZ